MPGTDSEEQPMGGTTHRIALDDPAARATAEEVAAALAAQLQRGGDTLDADVYDAWFAADILWGSPFGATVTGFAQLNAIHRRLMNQPAPPASAPAPVAASRFEVVSVLAPAPGVVVAQVRRQSLVPDGFSEMALYVLVERDGRWWLAAAQNTPIGRR
ncbi:DUF4440 domain-containing protein [Couchioplanes azureus]|uniref:DUF4440 domain-containing protein n=1 Tax=Couchioplanes caeruleus TaxID=56438 RepID=UPI001990F82A|nr:DUF4440 domain-containing protein [Couchioplanes caeruleus]GGQ73341.1 hypothetical protein GCM10010166_49220 [Couchioplanes caeruleus subsp. azureus]